MQSFLKVLFLLLIVYAVALIMNNKYSTDINLLFIHQNLHLGMILGIGFILSFSFGLSIGGSAWVSSNTKYAELKKANDGLKGKLQKVNEDLEYQTKKMNIFEDTIKVAANKKPPPPKKKAPPKKTFLGIPF